MASRSSHRRIATALGLACLRACLFSPPRPDGVEADAGRGEDGGSVGCKFKFEGPIGDLAPCT